jgi:hypothetical protein
MPESFTLHVSVFLDGENPEALAQQFAKHMQRENGYPVEIIDWEQVDDHKYRVSADIAYDVWDDEDPEEVALSIIESVLDADGNPVMVADDITERDDNEK